MKKPLLLTLTILILLAAGSTFFLFQKKQPTKQVSKSSSSSSTAALPQTEEELQKNTTTPGTAARLTLRGKDILDTNGNPINLRGFSWGRWGTAQPGDGKENAEAQRLRKQSCTAW